MSVSEIQDQIEVTVVGCRGLRYTKWFSRKKPYAVISYGGRIHGTSTCIVGGEYPIFCEKIVIKPIERFREMFVEVWNSNIIVSDDFIGTGMFKLETVLSEGSDEIDIPLLSFHDGEVGMIHLTLKYSSAEVCNASSEIMDIPSKVGKLETMEASSNPNNADVRRETIVGVMKKVKDAEMLKEKGIANIESSGRFLKDLEKTAPKRFSHEELKKFTSGFAYKVGFGGFGDVYKGQFLDGTEVAVKVLAENNFVKEIFEAEVGMMFRTSHRNLVKFYGYCFDDNIKALVLEYMRNGSLDKVLYENHLSLEWERLYQISIEIAKGLSYLHDGCDDQIIHHDVKAGNVLLDANLSPKITDFGLARLMSRGVSHFTWTGIRGTHGYTAPEMCIPSSEITHKCDVYSFGMMMFEVLGMRRNGEGSEWFPKQVWLKFENGELDEIINYCGIHKMKDRGNAKILSMVALWCAQFTPRARPHMSSVVKMLEGEILVKQPPNPFLPTPEVLDSNISPSLSIDTRYSYYN